MAKRLRVKEPTDECEYEVGQRVIFTPARGPSRLCTVSSVKETDGRCLIGLEADQKENNFQGIPGSVFSSSGGLKKVSLPQDKAVLRRLLQGIEAKSERDALRFSSKQRHALESLSPSPTPPGPRSRRSQSVERTVDTPWAMVLEHLAAGHLTYEDAQMVFQLFGRDDKRALAEILLRGLWHLAHLTLPEKNRDVLQSIKNLTKVLERNENLEEAEKMHRTAVAICVRCFKKDHTYTLNGRNNLAIVLKKQGRWQEAEQMHREVLEVRRRVLGENHEDTQRSRNNLASVLREQGKWQEVEDMYRELLEVRRRDLSEDHRDILSIRHNLASVLQEGGKWQEAEQMRREVMEVRRQNAFAAKWFKGQGEAKNAHDRIRKEATLLQLASPVEGRLVLLGDTHGHWKDVVHIWKAEGLPSKNLVYVFNGDICDRGDSEGRGGQRALQIWASVLAFKIAMPDSIFVLRGNHEDRDYWPQYGAQGFSGEIEAKYVARERAEVDDLLDAFGELCDQLPLAAVIHETCLVMHGGLPRCWKNGGNLQELQDLERPLRIPENADSRQKQLIYDATWADPQFEEGLGPNERGGEAISFGPVTWCLGGSEVKAGLVRRF
eukprot:symbB.v1.2.021686.t1/scaffold1889.1/size97066/1